MPLYEIECLSCGSKEDVIIGLSEISTIKDTKNMDMTPFGISCKTCKKHRFKKLLVPNAKMATNWAAWSQKKK